MRTVTPGSLPVDSFLGVGLAALAAVGIAVGSLAVRPARRPVPSRTSVAVVTPVLGVSTLFVVAGAAVLLQREERVPSRFGTAAVLVAVGVAFVVRG